MDEIVERKYPRQIRKLKELLQSLPAADHHRLELLPVPADRRALLCLRLAEDQLQEVPVRRDRRRRHRLRDLHLPRRLGAAQLASDVAGSADGRSRWRMTRRPENARDRRDRRSGPGDSRSKRGGQSRPPTSDWPRNRARNSGSSRRSNSKYGCCPFERSQVMRAIEPRRIERLPHHDFATGVKAHAAALPHRDQHRIGRQSIAHQLGGLAVAPFHALQLERLPIAGGARADDAEHHGRDRNHAAHARLRAADARSTALARISSTTSAGIRNRRYHHSGNGDTAGRSRSRPPAKPSSSTAPLRLMPSKTSGASRPISGTMFCVWNSARAVVRQVRR